MEKRAARKGKESRPDRGIVTDERGQDQPKDKSSAQTMGMPARRTGKKTTKRGSSKAP